MKKHNKKNMCKKGQIVETIFLIGILIIGGVGSYKIIFENRYVGDQTTLTYYDLSKCDINSINRDNIINFKDVKEAKENGYSPAKCS